VSLHPHSFTDSHILSFISTSHTTHTSSPPSLYATPYSPYVPSISQFLYQIISTGPWSSGKTPAHSNHPQTRRVGHGLVITVSCRVETQPRSFKQSRDTALGFQQSRTRPCRLGFTESVGGVLRETCVRIAVDP
jgi:hypothetical protein